MNDYGEKKRKKLTNRDISVWKSDIFYLYMLCLSKGANRKVPTESFSRSQVYWEFVPDTWCIKTELCFSTFCFDSGDSKPTCPRWWERFGWFINRAPDQKCVLALKRLMLDKPTVKFQSFKSGSVTWELYWRDLTPVFKAVKVKTSMNTPRVVGF